MKLFKIVFIISIITFGIVMMRIEVARSGRTIGKLQNEVEIKEARNQYLKLEEARLGGPQTIEPLAQEKLKLRRTPPQSVVVLDK
ncbi:MAG: cell division protein FtsL [Elusimicrobiaceae bacterium]|nr:cell division protein FtsL [Elusimicrobiaceae bacterium]